MAPRPRKNNSTSVPNLYPRKYGAGKVSYRYKDIRTGKFHPLGADLLAAEKQAKQLNALISQQMIEEEAKKILNNVSSSSITVGAWCDQYELHLLSLFDSKDIKKSTYDQKRWALNPIKNKYASKKLNQFSTLDINKLLKSYTSQGKSTMAQRIRTVLIDFFAEAIAEGHFPANQPNPAEVTKMPRTKVKRARLTLDLFNAVIGWSKENQPAYLWKSYLLALVTAQRLDDIGEARFRDTKKGAGLDKDREFFCFTQSKTGTKLMIPMDLKLNVLDLSVADVVNLCRDKVVSPFLFHHSKFAGRAKPGSKVRTKSLSNGFAEAVKAVKPNWGENTPPSFHEIRSLSEREYKKQGVNTQLLLGHKHQTTTDTYADTRGHDWVIVPLEKSS